MIAAKISSRQPARNPFGPKKISFIADLLSDGKGGGTSPLEGIPGGVIALLNSGVAEPMGAGAPIFFSLPSAEARISQMCVSFRYASLRMDVPRLKYHQTRRAPFQNVSEMPVLRRFRGARLLSVGAW